MSSLSEYSSGVIRSRLRVTKQTARARQGLVVAEHPVGAEVGAAILAGGGNAVDAAVATAFAMTVVEPFMSTIAGGGTMLVSLARQGIVADWYLALTAAKFQEELSAFPEAARTYLRDGRWVYRPPGMEPGDRIRSPDLARSLELLARDGAAAFYKGPLGQALAAEMRAHGGFLTAEDLANYAVRLTPPLRR